MKETLGTRNGLRERADFSAARWFRMLSSGAPTGLAVIGLDGTVLLANTLMLDLGGFDRAEPKQSIFDCVVSSERDNVRDAFDRACKGETVRFETILRRPDGGSTLIGVTIYPLYFGKRLVGVGTRIHDRSQLREAEQRRLETRQSIRLHQLYMVAASAGRTAAQQIEALLKLGNELLGTNISWVTEVSGDELVTLYTVGSGVKKGPGFRRKIGETFAHFAFNEGVIAVDDLEGWRDELRRIGLEWTAMIATPIERFGKQFGTFGFATDARGGHHFSESDKELIRLMSALCGSTLERLAHEERLGTLAFYDGLTGLPNRVLFDDRVEQTLIAAKRHGQRFSLMFFDLDDFKDVNDLHGHAAGDELLRVVAHRLQAIARESDTVARRGGDEFVALQRFVRSPNDAMRLARRVNEALRQPIALDSAVIAISTSIGVAIYPDHGTTARELLAHADEALYRAKNAGRDCAVLYKELVTAPN